MYKQVIVIRKDLKMRRGKEIAQGSHASMAFLTRQLQSGNTAVQLSDEAKEWMEKHFTKVCLQAESEAELLNIYAKAKEKGLEVQLITDSGRTEFNGVPTKTCLAIGPNYADRIDEVTCHLKLY
ncbi:MAG: aminoacyl-tRNA hydrolase [Bacteroidia bacterium]|nr:aminoacyl-tRNA hydrolase [Bacteroidia bacterium]